MPLVVCEWWAYDRASGEARWSIHRVAAPTQAECHAIASRAVGHEQPYAFRPLEGEDDSPALANPGRIVSAVMMHGEGEREDWRVRDEGETFGVPVAIEGMGRFYRRMES